MAHTDVLSRVDFEDLRIFRVCFKFMLTLIYLPQSFLFTSQCVLISIFINIYFIFYILLRPR